MFVLNTSYTSVRRTLATAVLALCLAGTASAEGYDLNKVVPGGGGGGGADPVKRRIVASRGEYICLDVSEGPGNQVRLTLRSAIPEPNARIAHFDINTGRHTDLFAGMNVVVQSMGLKSTLIQPKAGAASRVSNVHYQVDFPYDYRSGRHPPGGGLAPGNFIVISANLGPGKTIGSVMGALNEAMNPATEASGLRISVRTHYLLGGPPPGVATIQDDGTFVVRGVNPNCRSR